MPKIKPLKAPLIACGEYPINISLGTILGMAVNITGYFYGSSKGSADKNAAMIRSAETQQNLPAEP